MLGNDCEPLALLSTEPGAQRLPSCYAPIWARASAQLVCAARRTRRGDSRARLRRPRRGLRRSSRAVIDPLRASASGDVSPRSRGHPREGALDGLEPPNRLGVPNHLFVPKAHQVRASAPLGSSLPPTLASTTSAEAGAGAPCCLATEAGASLRRLETLAARPGRASAACRFRRSLVVDCGSQGPGNGVPTHLLRSRWSGR